MSVDKTNGASSSVPKSGAFRPQAKWEKVEKCLKEKGVSYDHVQSESAKSVERLVKMMINNGYKTIVIVGGDSALNEAVNCPSYQAQGEKGRPGMYQIYQRKNEKCHRYFLNCLTVGLVASVIQKAQKGKRIVRLAKTHFHPFLAAHDLPAAGV